ncbi:ligase-associated DNA damage response endonuclease PdeM [Paracoccus luteus]|uniref:ligase-associated DNA damage response endonuclease PdeM n=1 Tax=Paracoccus luteus TaxID=2508543 RepID=UPI00106FF7AA|nr:ligase-associated DNA damage response endonuclease PdeM [Paracoccus luteus]
MTGFGFSWHGLRLELRCSGALWWPGGRALVVADLHLGKSERMARRGGPLLPPYETAETLRRLSDEMAALDPAVVVSLGDGFDDDAAAGALEAEALGALGSMAAGRDWIWVAGNHDPAPAALLPGRMLPAMRLSDVTLRHDAQGDGPDISGHYHPVVRLAGARRRAALVGPRHLILPAFGSYTGGLDAADPALARWVAGGFAVVCMHRALPVPLPPAAGQHHAGQAHAG